LGNLVITSGTFLNKKALFLQYLWIREIEERRLSLNISFENMASIRIKGGGYRSVKDT
jgi:hypothetical protein